MTGVFPNVTSGINKEQKIPKLRDLERVLVGEGTSSERWEWRIRATEIVHHPTEPAVQYTDGDWFWYWMNKPHRLDGPAAFWDGEYKYWIMHERLSRDQWERHPLRLEQLVNRMDRI